MLLATVNVFLGCRLPTFAFFASGGFSVFALGFPLFSQLQRRSMSTPYNPITAELIQRLTVPPEPKRPEVTQRR